MTYVEDGRLQEHPILEFERKREVTIYFNGKPIKAYEGETSSPTSVSYTHLTLPTIYSV